MASKAQASGLDPSGVPIIDVCGDVVQGFSQANLEQLLQKHGLLGGTATATSANTVSNTGTGTGTQTNACTITIYGTSSCPWCTKAREYMKSKGVPFADKDVGQDQAANQEMVQKLKAKGISPSGVPVIDICGDMMVGYSEGQIDQLLQKHGFTSGGSGGDSQKNNPGN
ncbi:MAG: hypothetical protein HQM09_02950 [Candidatus Riflebacteria bacterium]|nr:hypothetical protein [Candidatus Riflebacteria bacterium]